LYYAYWDGSSWIGEVMNQDHLSGSLDSIVKVPVYVVPRMGGIKRIVIYIISYF